jgi:hypothetical protein
MSTKITKGFLAARRALAPPVAGYVHKLTNTRWDQYFRGYSGEVLNTPMRDVLCVLSKLGGDLQLIWTVQMDSKQRPFRVTLDRQRGES